MKPLESVLAQCRVRPEKIAQFAPPIEAAFLRFNISELGSRAGFLAHALHESADFTRLEENLYYSTPERICAVWPSRVPTLEMAARLARNPEALANAVYSDRMGNGSAASGDGWRYRGRGLFQLTGRDNYRSVGKALDQPYDSQPDLVAQPPDAVLTAVYYWSKLGAINMSIADSTRRVNGGTNGLGERTAIYHRVLGAMQ